MKVKTNEMIKKNHNRKSIYTDEKKISQLFIFWKYLKQKKKQIFALRFPK